jgi:hypothetical protein
LQILLDLVFVVIAFLGLLALIGISMQKGKAPGGARGGIIVAVVMMLIGVGGLGAINEKATSSVSAPSGQQPSPPATTTPGITSHTPTPTPSQAKSTKLADPEANPTSTAAVSTTGLSAPSVPSGAARYCRSGNPTANVYHPYRLQVVKACVTAAGIVETVRHEDDGDYHIDVLLDAAYRGMLDAGNVAYQHGWLVVEIVPADEPGCTVGQPPRPVSGTYNYGICTGANETPPAIGQHVWITGPYVIDHWHNWAEIHPAWLIGTTRPSGVSSAGSSPTPTPTPKPTPANSPKCSASMSDASPARYSSTYVNVHTSPGAAVTTTAHYKTKDTTHTGTADASGNASIAYTLASATLGFQVIVDVSVSLNGATESCSTSFTPA